MECQQSLIMSHSSESGVIEQVDVYKEGPGLGNSAL